MTRIDEIACILNVTKEIAQRVLDEMDKSEIDYSECTQEQFNQCAIRSLRLITNGVV